MRPVFVALRWRAEYSGTNFSRNLPASILVVWARSALGATQKSSPESEMISGQFAFSTKCRLAMIRSLAAASFVACMVSCLPAHAQFGNFFGNRQGVVGGVSVDAQGTLRSASTRERQGQLAALRDAVKKPEGDIASKTELRMISLAKLQAEVARVTSAGETLSEDVLYLAGLQRVQYIFVYPEQNDIVLAGPAEAWVVRDDATVVGESTGRPVIHLEDLITALRATNTTRKAPMSVSIDPTAEGELRLRNLLSRMNSRFNPAQAEPAIKKAFGPQVVSLTAVPTDSRMANTLVAADYRMKRLAMDLESSPVAGLPSYMQMIKNSGAQQTQPRWWMASDYDAILHSDDMLAWKLTGTGIKAMTEEEIVAMDGSRKQTGKANKVAEKWANLFTEKFNELCSHNAAFGDLRNVMDLNIAATVIAAHDLEGVAGCDFGFLRGASGSMKMPSWRTPKTIAPECSFVRGNAGWTVSASGGVELNPWKIVGTQAKADSAVASVHAKARPTGASWWWN